MSMPIRLKRIHFPVDDLFCNVCIRTGRSKEEQATWLVYHDARPNAIPYCHACAVYAWFYAITMDRRPVDVDGHDVPMPIELREKEE